MGIVGTLDKYFRMCVRECVAKRKDASKCERIHTKTNGLELLVASASNICCNSTVTFVSFCCYVSISSCKRVTSISSSFMWN